MTMGSTASPTDNCCLSRLLSLTSSIYGESKRTPSSVTSLTLRQLVPINYVLCQSTVSSRATGADEDESLQPEGLYSFEESSMTVSQLENVIARVVSELPVDSHEAAPASVICFELLFASSHSSDEKHWKNYKNKLLIIQYLLYITKDGDLHGLATIVLPLLFTHCSEDEMREAMLDAAFLLDQDPPEKDKAWLQVCLNICLRNIIDDHVEGDCSNSSLHRDHRRWTIACRVLVRIWENVRDSPNRHKDARRMVLQCVHDKILQGIRFVASMDIANNREQVAPFLRPITTSLLPVLYNHKEQSAQGDKRDLVAQTHHSDKLWTTLMDFSKQEQNTTSLVVTTAVLCTVLPSLLEVELPTSKYSQQERANPIFHPALWELIHACLCRGINGMQTKVEETANEASIDQMLRRRGVHLLRILVENAKDNIDDDSSSIWIAYAMCFEALEMEKEQHLVDQVWDTVSKLCVAAADASEADSKQEETGVPLVSWLWVSALLSRVLLNEIPVLQKLGLYRFLNGDAGICMPLSQKSDQKGDSNQDRDTAPMSLVSPEFVVNVVLVCYDSLCASIGTIMQYEENGKKQLDNLTDRLTLFLETYVQSLVTDSSETRVIKFLQGILSPSTMCGLRTKTALLVYNATATTLLGYENAILRLDKEILVNAVRSFRSLIGTGSAVLSFYKGLLRAFAIILSRSELDTTMEPKTLISVLSLYPSSVAEEEVDEDTTAFLQKWLGNLGGADPSWACDVGAACASAFLSGELLPLVDAWEPRTGFSEAEMSTGKAIALLCDLSANDTDSTTASELVWPSIHKAVSLAPRAMIGSAWTKAQEVTRGLILLDTGCKLGFLSGMGNGELVVDQGSEHMIPPPDKIESLLKMSVDFVLHCIQALTSRESDGAATESSGSTRSSETSRVSSRFALLISFLETLNDAFPSSMSISSGIDEMFKLSIDALTSDTKESTDVVKNTALSYAALSCGAKASAGSTDDIKTCQAMLRLSFSAGDSSDSKAEGQAARSVFQYAKWGALSLLLPELIKLSQDGEKAEAMDALLDELFSTAIDAVHATPPDALLPLFECTLKSARSRFLVHNSGRGAGENLLTDFLEKLIASLFTVLLDAKNSSNSTYMLNEMCSLIFQSQLLLEEYNRYDRSLENHTKESFPIRDAFLRMMEMAGTKRSHISKCATSWITVGWLAADDTSSCGLSAIPYRHDIARLLVHKETKMDESSIHQQKRPQRQPEGAIELPSDSSDVSVVRGFLLFFLSRLPDADNGLAAEVLSDLLHFIILHLLDEVCLTPPKQGSMIMIGSTDYCNKMRAWQALCVLSRFVTPEIAADVCQRVFDAMSLNLHGEIRYFMEIFAIQFARKHPSMFRNAYLKQVRRSDLSLQHISSLMIIGGHMIVGPYEADFFSQFSDSETKVAALHEVLAGTIPWLSSTQGFSRAIAQLLVHKLIPLVVEVNSESNSGDSDWFLQSIYNFLEENPEMKRLRSKQTKYFDRTDIDAMCTPEGVLTVPVGDSDEANPVHMVEAVKRCLDEVYQEAHKEDAPVWKQVEEMLQEKRRAEGERQEKSKGFLANYQRKILPLDSLNLALEESRERSLRNARGRRKQHLIVCASLIDKVPNLGGLARTSEIFAAEQLVIPDLKVCGMDSFKSISVGAEDWIEIAECKEKDLLGWLRHQKEKGYTIVGLEQTSSSISISDMAFPERTVLLLGKEKEGIPVELLQVVDICVEIPQQGVIRSLNVHVTGAVAIWEYTKQMMASAP